MCLRSSKDTCPVSELSVGACPPRRWRQLTHPTQHFLHASISKFAGRCRRCRAEWTYFCGGSLWKGCHEDLLSGKVYCIYPSGETIVRGGGGSPLSLKLGDSKQFQCTGRRVEQRLVLVDLCSRSRAYACVTHVYQHYVH